MPRDFPEHYRLYGWEARDVLEVSTPMFKRWCEEAGHDALKADRRRYLESFYGNRGMKVGGRRPTFTQ